MNLNHNRKIHDLVGENYVFASVLYYFGIEFYEYSEKTLSQVCQEKGLDVNKVINSLESVTEKGDGDDFRLFSYPIEIIIEYLKHTHFYFIKQRLPYLAKLIHNLNDKHGTIAKDLKFVFPYFIEDLVKHIYEEEDNLFTYIMKLAHALNDQYHYSSLHYDMERQSIQAYAMEHDMDDDELKGVRSITDDYKTDENTSLHLKVIYAELKSFEKELHTHAKVENEVLFPKALMLEKQVKQKFKSIIKLN